MGGERELALCRCSCCKCCRCDRCCKCCVCVVRKDCCGHCCGKDCCEQKCKEECEQEQSVCEIMQSIALQEAGLAHILNAEGEKIQRAAKIARRVDELLEVNRSVIDTINSVTQLEFTLVSKLNALQLGSKCRQCNY